MSDSQRKDCDLEPDFERNKSKRNQDGDNDDVSKRSKLEEDTTHIMQAIINDSDPEERVWICAKSVIIDTLNLHMYLL